MSESNYRNKKKFSNSLFFLNINVLVWIIIFITITLTPVAIAKCVWTDGTPCEGTPSGSSSSLCPTATCINGEAQCSPGYKPLQPTCSEGQSVVCVKADGSPCKDDVDCSYTYTIGTTPTELHASKGGCQLGECRAVGRTTGSRNCI